MPVGTFVNSGDTILTSQHNPAMQDISQAITNSLSRNGLGGMLADLGMNNNRITDLAPGVNPGDAARMDQLGGVPVGIVFDYWGDIPPPGYMFPFGQELSRSEYADLFAVIGTSAGVGNGTTTFNLPDYRAVVSAGRADMGGSTKSLLSKYASTVMAAIFGVQEHTLTEAQMPGHNHGGGGSVSSVADHFHTTTGTPAASNGISEVRSNVFGGGNTQQSPSSFRVTDWAGGHTHTYSIPTVGGSTAHPNVQPTIICNKIMRVTV